MIKNLKKLRNEMGISQRQLGEQIGVSQQSINKYDNHEIEPDIQTLIQMADYFETSVDYLVGHTENRHIIENTSFFDLNSEEATFMDNYRKLSKPEREMLLLLAATYLNPRKK